MKSLNVHLPLRYKTLHLMKRRRMAREVEKSKVKDPLAGITLEKILTELITHYDWVSLGQIIPINCFLKDPSVKSSLTFLRTTPWARTRVEQLYLRYLEEKSHEP